MTFEEFKNLKPGDIVVYRKDHANRSLQGLKGVITDIHGTMASVKTDLGSLLTAWTGDGECCFDFPESEKKSFLPKEDLKIDKESSFYDIVRAETRERIRKEEEQRPRNSAFEFL